jgi:hypothetical protein
MTTQDQLTDIEDLKQVMARYARYGDTKNWEEFRKLFTEDAVFSFEAMPRATKDEPQSGTFTEGRDAYIGGMGEMLKGVQTCHNMYLPDITITGPTTATVTWGLHDLVKLPTCVFNGYGHIHQDYVKVDGQWKITKSHTSRLFVEEQWL